MLQDESKVRGQIDCFASASWLIGSVGWTRLGWNNYGRPMGDQYFPFFADHTRSAKHGEPGAQHEQLAAEWSQPIPKLQTAFQTLDFRGPWWFLFQRLLVAQLELNQPTATKTHNSSSSRRCGGVS